MGIHNITFADFLVFASADVGFPRSSVAQTSQIRPDLFSRWDTELSHTLYGSWRRGSRQTPSPLMTVTIGYRRGQGTTKELWTGVIGRVAALLSFPRVTIPIMISCHNSCSTQAPPFVPDRFRRPLRGRILRHHRSLGRSIYLG